MAEGRPVFSPEYWAQTYLELRPATVILGWLYNRSKGSVRVAGIAHAAGNATFAFFPNLDWTVYTLTAAAAALVMIVADKWNPQTTLFRQKRENTGWLSARG